MLIFTLTVVLLYSTGTAEPAPLPMEWNSTHTFGNDGPWQAITLKVGFPEQPLNLLPGGVWGSCILSTNVNNTYGSYFQGFSANDAGVYDVSTSNPSAEASTENNAIADASHGGAQASFDGGYDAVKAMNLDGGAIMVTDRITFSSLGDQFFIPNSSIAAVYDSSWTTPDGRSIPTDIGTFSLGQSAPLVWGDFVGNMVPQYLAAQGTIPSNSWGLHVGSAALQIPGSLYFGGYDKSRVLGAVGTYDSQNGHGDMFVNLIDVNVQWAAGSSPFSNPANTTKLLRDSQGVADSIPVRVNPTVSWLFLPRQTCDALAALLPITLNADLDLYLWETDDPQYSRLMRSPTFIQFVFQRTGGQTNLSINVPIALFNLTLSSPLATPDVAYFPCRGYSLPTSDSEYHLGRAFLQAAFIGMHWGTSKWWMAQAPGPGALTPSTTSIENSTAVIDSFTDRSLWESSWSGFWTPLPTATTATTTTSSSSSGISAKASPTSSVQHTPVSPAPSKSQDSGLSPGLKAAIGVIITLLVFAIAVPLYVFFKRRRSAAMLTRGPTSSYQSSSTISLATLKPYEKAELDNHRISHTSLRSASSKRNIRTERPPSAIHELGMPSPTLYSREAVRPREGV